MAFKRIFKWNRKKKSRSGSGDPSADTPTSIAAIQNTSSPLASSVRGSTLGSQPPLNQEPMGTSVTGTRTDSWNNLTAFSDILHRTPLFAPLAEAIDDLRSFVRAHEEIATTQREYQMLRTQLEGLCKDLCTHFSQDVPPAMTISMHNLCEAIQTEMREVYGTHGMNTTSRYMQADRDADKITRCYRRIQAHLERVMLNASLSMWKAIDKHAAEAQLRLLNPSMSACYDSAEASIVQRRECAPKTRERVILDLKSWKDKDGEKVCWINGMAGTGKTTISYSFCSILRNDHQLGASFFCSRLLPACRDAKLILPTIAYQLARFSSPYRNALLQVLEADPDVHTKLLGVQFKHMIMEPLRMVARSLPSTIVVVIDALDECDDISGVEQILQVLLEHASKLPVKFLISSRPEYHIRQRIQESPQLILHELDHTMVKADIATYLREELAHKSIPVADSQLLALVERAGALFIYAATVIRYIKGGDSSERLKTVLKAPSVGQGPTNKTKEIDRLYETVLVSALENDDLEDSEKEQMELVLHTVICAQEPLTVDALSGLLKLERNQVLAALKPLWSVLHVSESSAAHRVSILHASFPDYMLDFNRSKQFACNSRVHNGKLADLCLRRIRCNPSQFNICNLESSYKLDEDVPDLAEKVGHTIAMDLSYACQYWAVHLELSETSDGRDVELYDFLSKRLLFWMEVLNLTKQIEKGVKQMGKVIFWLQARECSESIINLARDARRFVTMFATSPVSQSTPHIYASMLASWPDHQPISNHYARQTVDLVRIDGIETTERQIGLLSSIPVGCMVNCVAYSPNGKLIAAGTSHSGILVWDAASCRMTIDAIKGHTDHIRAIAFSPDSTQICSGSYDKTLRVWNVQNGQLVAGPLKGHASRIWSVHYSPDGGWLASGSRDGSVCIWNTSGWQQIRKSIMDPIGKVFSVAFSPDGSIIAASSDSLIHLLDPSSGQPIGEPLKGHTDHIWSLAFLPDGKYLISGSDDCTICIWEVATGQLAFDPLREHLRPVYNVAASPDGNFFVSTAVDDTIRIWDTKSWQSRSSFRNTGTVRSTMFSPDGSNLVSGSRDGYVRIWEVQNASKSRSTHNQFEGHNNWVKSVIFSPCGTSIISGSSDMTVRVWDFQSKNLIFSLPKGHNDRILSVGVTTEGDHIFSISSDRIVYVWRRQTGELEYTLGPIETDGDYDRIYHEEWPAAFIFNSRRVVCGSKSGRIYMWEDNKLSFSSAEHHVPVTSIAFAPDGKLFASSYQDGALMIWNTSTGQRMFGPLTGHSARINCIVFSPDGTRIASGSDDRTIQLCGSFTGIPEGYLLLRHSAPVRSVAFSPSGDHLVSGSVDMLLHVWDLVVGHSIAVFKGHTDVVLSVGFSPDGTQIVSSSGDMTIRLWNAPEAATPQHRTINEVAKGAARSETHGEPTFEWELDTDGWVRHTEHQLLLWVPLDLRSVLLSQQNSSLISRQGCIKLNFFGAKIGDDWKQCYNAFPPATG